MRRSAVPLAGLGVLLATGCTPDAPVLVEQTPQLGIVDRLNLAPGSVEAVHATLLERTLADLEADDIRPARSTHPTRRYDVGVSRHEEATVEAARRAPMVSPARRDDPGVFTVQFGPVFLIDAEGNFFPAGKAVRVYENPPDGQGAWAYLMIFAPDDAGPNDLKGYVVALKFNAQENRWRVVGLSSENFGDRPDSYFRQWLKEVIHEAR